MTRTAPMAGATTVQQTFAIPALAAAHLTEASAVAAALNAEGQALIAKARALHAAAVAPVLAMLGVGEGNIIDVSATADGAEVTVVVPASSAASPPSERSRPHLVGGARENAEKILADVADVAEVTKL